MPKVIDKSEKKIQILDAAIKLIAEKGTSLKVSEIADKAGIGKGTIYEYFHNKEQIIIESFLLFMQEIDNSINMQINNVQNPFKRLDGFFQGWIDALDSPMSKYFEVIFHFWAEGILKKSAPEYFDMNAMYSKYRGMIKGLLDDCISLKNPSDMDTNISAAILIGALDGLFLQWIIDKNSFDLKKAIYILRDMYITILNMKK